MNYRIEVENSLLPILKSSRCVILDAPYYNNVGDVLIWEGMEQFIAKHKIECLYRSSVETFEFRQFDDDVCVFLVGGGNFGDLWRGLQEFRNRIVESYPNNRIIVFPQSVHYDREDLLQEDHAILSKHKDLFLCAREQKSYELLKKHFAANNILLLPDMALYVDYSKYPKHSGEGTLFLKRNDKEAVQYNLSRSENIDITDWPMHMITEEERIRFVKQFKWNHRFLRHICAHISNEQLRMGIGKMAMNANPCRLNKWDIRHSWVICYCECEYLTYLNRKYKGLFNPLLDYWMYTYHRPSIIRYGISFIDEYKHIISTRLHAGIIAAMLDKQTTLMDNSYGKISGVYDAWLDELKNVQMECRVG